MKKIRNILVCLILPVMISGLGAGCLVNSSNLEVESTLCVGCGKCVTVCPYNAITVLNNKAVIDPSKCQHCGKCVKVCPYDAIH